MNFTGEIHISEVLAILSKPTEKIFSLYIVKSTGKGKGDFRYINKVRKGAPAKPRTSTPTRKTNKALHKQTGTLPMTDIERDKYITPLISHIVGFNHLKVIH